MEEMTKHEKIERAYQIANEAADKLIDYLDNKNDAKKVEMAALDLIWAISFMHEMLEETTNETKETKET